MEGTFTYTPATGTVLGAGNNQTLSVLFTPDDTTDYTTASATATINVSQATPTISWANPANILFGTALSGTQLDANSSWTVGGVSGSVAGAFTYTPAAGTVLSVGNNQTLSVAFTPIDATDYTTASATASINVVGANPTSVYVASAYTADAPGTAVTWSDGSTHYVGLDAFGTIQAGIAAVVAGGTVNIASGTYTEQLTIDENLTLVGAGVSATTIQAPSDLNGNEIEIASAITLTMSGLSVDGASTSTAIDVNGGELSASSLAITGYSVGVSVENGGGATITDSTISATTGILVGSGASDTATLTATNDSFAGDAVGVQNNQTSGTLTATMDWWGSRTGPTSSSNPGGTGATVIGSFSFSPWLGDANIVAPDYLVFLATTGNSFVVTPNSANTSLGISLGGSSVGSIPGGGTLSFAGTGATVTINGESGTGSTNVFTIQDTSVQFNAADALAGTTISFLGTGMTRYVDAQGTTDTFNIQGAGASGPSGSLVGGSGTNAFIFSPTGKLIGSIQGSGNTTLNYSAYSSAVNVNLENGTNGTATGVTGTVTGITAVIGGNSNDTLNAGTVPKVALTGGLGTNSLSGTGTGDSVVESIASGYTLTNTKLTGTGAAFTDNLSGITVASLTGVSSTSNAFTVSGWSGSGSLSAPAGTGTVTDSASGSFTLTNSQLTAANTTLSLNGVTTANLTDSGNAHTFTITGWTGTGTLKGTAETLVDSVPASATLTNTSLTVTGGPTSTLSGFTTANLTDTTGGNTFTVSGWTKSGSLTDSAAFGDTVTASKSAGYTLTNASLSATDGMSLGLSGITTANLAATTAGKTFTVSGWTGSGSLTDTATGIVTASKNAGFTLTNTSLISTDDMGMSLSGITNANLTDSGSGGNTFTITGWTGKGTLTGSPDTLVDTVAANATLTNTSLAVTGLPTLTLSGFPTANLTDTTGGNTFTVSGWTGSGSITDSAATGDTVTASKSAGFTLTNSSLASTDGMSLGLSNVTTANLTDSSSGGGNTFTITGWTGSGSLKGSPDTLADSVSTSVVLANASLAVTGLPALTLSGFTTANLTDTTGGNTFTVSGWTKSGSLTDSAAFGDTVTASKSAGYTLTNASLSATDGMSLGLSGITTANLAATTAGKTFTVSGWTGSGSLTDTATGIVTASKNAGFTLTNTSLISTDDMGMSLSGITNANLTDSGSGGNTFTITGWTGKGTLTGSPDTLVDTVAANATLTNTSLAVTGLPTLTLSGFPTANLTDTTGGNTFTVSGWTGSGSITDSAATGDTVTASKSAGFTLTNSSLASTDGMSLGLSNVTTANLTDSSSGGGNTFTITGWTGSGKLKGSAETLVDGVSSSLSLAKTSLAVTGLPTLTLSGFTTANLTDTAGGNTFTVDGWTGSGSLTDSASIADTVAASKSASFTLTNTSLSSTDGMALGLSGITTANLAATSSGKTFTVSGWTGSGSLIDTSSGIVTASKSAGFTLTNGSLTSTDGMSVSLSGITTANLTATATSGSPSYIVDASAFTGVTNLTAGGTVDAILFGGSANGGTLSATGSGNNVLIGGSGKNTLTDTSSGDNILIGGAGADSITGNGNDILISGTTSYDSNTSANIAALDAILAEWSSSDPYSLRISKIMSGVGSGGTDALNSSTCQSDGVTNTVSDGPSGAQNNWFIVNSKDKVTKQSNETETIV